MSSFVGYTDHSEKCPNYDKVNHAYYLGKRDGMQMAEVEILPIPLLLWCPECGGRHVDVGQFETKKHHTHACQHCGHVWRPAIECTVGVQFLPGFKNE